MLNTFMARIGTLKKAEQEAFHRVEQARRIADGKASVMDCPGCKFVKGQPDPVPSSSLTRLAIKEPLDHFFLGQNPGYEEERAGEPFVGASGKLLREAIERAGIAPETVGFGNAVACGTPQNAAPKRGMETACLHHIFGDLLRFRPRRLYLMGATAARVVMGSRKCSIMSLAYKRYEPLSKGLPEIAFFPHPAYILRVGVESMEAKAWAERLVKTIMAPPAVEVEAKALTLWMLWHISGSDRLNPERTSALSSA